MIKNSRQVDFLFKEDIWIIGIQIKFCRLKATLRWDTLVSPETLKILTELKVRQPCIYFSDLVSNAHERLRYKATAIKHRFLVYAEPFWFMPDSKWVEFGEQYAILEEMADGIRHDLQEALPTIDEELNQKVAKLSAYLTGHLKLESEDIARIQFPIDRYPYRVGI